MEYANSNVHKLLYRTVGGLTFIRGLCSGPGVLLSLVIVVLLTEIAPPQTVTVHLCFSPLRTPGVPLLQSGSLKKARLQQKRARLQKQRSQTASQKDRVMVSARNGWQSWGIGGRSLTTQAHGGVDIHQIEPFAFSGPPSHGSTRSRPSIYTPGKVLVFRWLVRFQHGAFVFLLLPAVWGDLFGRELDSANRGEFQCGALAHSALRR